MGSHIGPKSWFNDSKLGVMISWGLYSIPGWAPLDARLAQSLGGPVSDDGGHFAHLSPISTTSYSEWYLNSMSLVGTPTWFYHHSVYGGAPYDSFRQEFEPAADRLDVTHWLDVVEDAGARYVIPLTKHHDGYLLYPSRVPSPSQRSYGLRRDVIGDVASEARARGIRFGAYYSGGIDWSIAGLPISRIELLGEDREALARRFWPEPYGRYADAHWREIIDRYRPDILWNDIGYPEDANASDMFDYYYGHVPHGVVNDRFMEPHHDFRTPEYHEYEDIQDEPWELTRGVGMSFGFNRQETAADTLTGRELIQTLIRVVARNGNLLLGIGPDATGAISALQQASLSDLGIWLRKNGEGIYGTHPWRPQRGNNPTGAFWTRDGGSAYLLLENEGAYDIEVDDSIDLSSAAPLAEGVTIDRSSRDAWIRVTTSEPVVIRFASR